MDLGWIRNGRSHRSQRWELRDSGGGLVALADVDGRPLTPAAPGWPPWTGVPVVVCALAGGPLDGLWQYLDLPPGDGPPAELLLDPGGGRPPASYVLFAQVCGHGRACPFPYRYLPPPPNG
jgi:hypothetical protein